jgi:hypothetical protein
MLKRIRCLAKDTLGVILIYGIAAALILTPIAAWVTHVGVSIKSASWILLIVGALIFPVGIIHGVGFWFGWL